MVFEYIKCENVCGWLPGCCLDALNECFAVSRVFLGCYNVVDGY